MKHGIRRLARRFLHDRTAATAAEFAMVVPLFFIVVLGIFEYS